MEKDQVKALTGDQIVTLAVLLLGGDRKAIDTEDVAVKTHKLAPGRFSWRKHPEQINLELIRVNLSNAKKAEYGSLLSGSGRMGWTLTQAGLEWARVAQRQLVDIDLSRSRADVKSGSVDEQRWRRERSRLQSTGAWSRWKDGNREIPLAEAAEVFRIDSYSVGPMRETKIMRLRALFDEDDELGPFINRMAEIIGESEGL